MTETNVAMREVLAAAPGLHLEEQEQGRWAILGVGKHIVLRDLSVGVVTGLRSLFADGATQPELEAQASAGGDIGAAIQLAYLLSRFRAGGLVCRDYRLGERHLMRIEPTGRGTNAEPVGLATGGRYQLCRFTLLRRDQSALLIESPLAHCRIRVSDEALVRAIACLACGAKVEDLQGLLPGWGPADPARLLAVLVAETLVEEQGTQESDDLRGWEIQDLYFHTRSRLGRGGAAIGATYRFAATAPLPLLKPAMEGPTVPLPRPDLSQVARGSRPFCDVLEARRSIREHGESPISLHQLGELLFRVGRERRVHGDVRGQIGSRPYPTGGALYELDLYLAVDHCLGLDPGLYHYRPLEHELTMIRGHEAVHALAEGARSAMQSARRPQVLVVMTARFGRVNWKYESLAYALVLKDVGVVMQTLYLVATDMDLAPCALGTGDSDLFAQVSGLCYLQEGSVGEFALGSKPAAEEGENHVYAG